MSWLDASLYAHANTPSVKSRSDDLPPNMKPSEWLARLAAGEPGTPVDVCGDAEPEGLRVPRGKRVGVRKSSGSIPS